MITVALCTLAYRDEPVIDLIPKIAAAGYEGVEIFYTQLEGKSDAELAGIRKTAADNNLKIIAISPYLSFTRDMKGYDDSLAKVKEFIHYGEILGCHRIRTFTDVGPKGIASAAATPEAWAQGIRGLKQATALGPNYEFLLETHPLTLADTLDSTLRVLKDVAAPNLKVIYQPTTADFRNKGILECSRALKPHIAHMHVQNTARPGSDRGWLEDGVLDMAGFLKTVQAEGYDSTISVEYYWKDTPWERIESAYKFVAAALGRPPRTR